MAPNGNFSGSLYFPESLKKVSGGWGYPNMTGTLVIPRCMTVVGGFGGGGFNHVEFHDGVTEIADVAFGGSNFQGIYFFPKESSRQRHQVEISRVLCIFLSH